MFGHIPNNTSIKITAVFPISIMLAQNFKMGVGRPDLPLALALKRLHITPLPQCSPSN